MHGIFLARNLLFPPPTHVRTTVGNHRRCIEGLCPTVAELAARLGGCVTLIPWVKVTMPAIIIRPALDSLRSLPTLYQISESWGKLELKLETNDTRYWVTTEGVPKKTNGAPINYIVDYVTVEKLSEEGNWDLKAVYSPEAWRLSQGFDYCQVLQQELITLRDQLDTNFSWATLRQVEELERELEVATKVVSGLAAQVRKRVGS